MIELIFVDFADGEPTVRLDELLRWDPLVEGESLGTHAGDGKVVSNVRSRVYCKHTGFFYSALEAGQIRERVLTSAELMLHG